MAFGQNSGTVKKIAPRIPDHSSSSSDRFNILDGTKPKMNYSHLTQMVGAHPPSVERRNARERNRVKQVNNGFERLRQYIPRKIVEMENGGRGASKKLSKVDTLKLVVKYIHGLQHLLDEYENKLDDSEETMSTISSASSHKSSGVHSAEYSTTSSSDPAPSFIDYQTHRSVLTYSEPSISPAPSYHSDTPQQPVYYIPTAAPHLYQYGQHHSGASEAPYEDGGIEEDGILDDILHWQLQNA